MDPATIATVGTIVTTVGPLVIKCGEFIFKRYVPQMAATVTEEGFAAMGKKAGGNGLLGRIGGASGRAFGWVAGLFVEDKVRPMVNESAEGLAQEATKCLLGVVGTAAATYVAKKVESASSEASDDIDMRIKQQKLKHLEAKTAHKELKNELLKSKVALQQLKDSARREQVEAEMDKKRQERECWKVEDKLSLDTLLNAIDNTVPSPVAMAA